MAQKLELLPDGWPCTLAECPPGPFLYKEMVGFKSEYKTNQQSDAYCDTGEYFWGGTSDAKEREKLIVQPLVCQWQIVSEE